MTSFWLTGYRRLWRPSIPFILTLIFLASTFPPCSAQLSAPHDSTANAWPLRSTYYIGAGHESAFNTYLSPLNQSGTALSLGGEWSRGFSRPARHLSMTFAAEADFGMLQNPAHNNSLTDIGLRLSWHALRSFSPVEGLQIAPGAGILADAGLMYLPVNSNNPVAARVYAGLSLNGSAAYELRIGRLPVRLIDNVSLPALGIFFSPHYGQSYFEIYLGERNGLARCGWWGNHFCIDNLLAIEIPVRSVRLQLGYRLQAYNSRASQIESRIIRHYFQLGISTDWLNITRRP